MPTCSRRGKEASQEMTEYRIVYEVYNRPYNTFGESNYEHLEQRYYDRGAAYMHAFLLNKGWGNRARVEQTNPPEPVSEAGPEEVYNRFKFYYEPKKLSKDDIKNIARNGRIY